MFEYYRRTTVKRGGINDRRPDLISKLIVQSFGILPSAGYVFTAVLPLIPPDAVEHGPQTVFVTGEADKLPREDSTVRFHDRAYRVGVDAEVNSTYTLMEDVSAEQIDVPGKGKTQIPYFMPAFQGRSGLFFALAMLLDIHHIGPGYAERIPDPVIFIQDL